MMISEYLNEQFELLEFVFNSVHVDLKFNEGIARYILGDNRMIYYRGDTRLWEDRSSIMLHQTYATLTTENRIYT